ncbi:aspartic peptidase [Gramella sp. AN32]|uniref:Toxin-antitoxin system YwqK family antitoxin n=1 Tax=Christiangramia antarctica TaxID=2058158 RepID=A0ABW5X907_9FLAO|nr:aspartic peptidase [Gramella sp. AN32]MCM4154502.1 aspartic peptidase [Gramella sp. AN32]
MNKLSFFFFLIPFLSFAQVNQKDAEGNRNGLWKVNFEGTNSPKFEGTFDHGKEVGEFKFYQKGISAHPSAIMNFDKNSDTVAIKYYTQKGKVISEGNAVDKKREGEWKYYHQESDSIMMLENYKADSLHGLQQTFYTNGNLAEKTNYTEGLKEGASFTYFESGEVNKEINFKNGKLDGSAVYYDLQGNILRQGNYSGGKKIGTWKEFENGILKEEIEY